MSDVKPIEFDEPFDRAYIPVNSRYEVQTKGKGSSFRIANTMTHERWIITDERLHPMLTELAYGTHAELAQAQAEITRLNAIISDRTQDILKYAEDVKKLNTIISEMQQIDDVLAQQDKEDAKKWREFVAWNKEKDEMAIKVFYEAMRGEK